MRRCLGCNTLIALGSRCPVCRRDQRVPTDWANAVKARDRYRCVVCGQSGDVEAHHIIPRAQGGPHTLENGQTLCRRHHQEAHHSR